MIKRFGWRGVAVGCLMALCATVGFEAEASPWSIKSAKQRTEHRSATKKKRNSGKGNLWGKGLTDKDKKNAKDSVAAARTSGVFVSYPDRPKAPAGLDSVNIALWPSHGRYFDANEQRWNWQRPRLMGTVEDLLPQELVLTYLAPMLENAGAYVMMPRERDRSSIEVIADRDAESTEEGYAEHRGRKHRWTSPDDITGFGMPDGELAYGDNPFEMGEVRQISTVTSEANASKAQWNPAIPKAGEYAVYVSYASLPNSAEDARYTVNSLRGSEEVVVNQTMGGGTWVYLGTYPFAAGRSHEPLVELSNLSASEGKVVTADAVKIGGGMGNVARGEEPTVSGDPRFMEGSRYWLQWAGMPQSVYSATDNKKDYEDDYKSRGFWVNYLAGGSKKLPGEEGLGIPVDLSLALHTDAGTSDSAFATIGTLPIVCTAGDPLGTRENRTTSIRYADAVTRQIVNDIRAQFDPKWNSRELRDKAYAEARTARVPALLMEMLSHQNFSDMRLMLNPEFEFTLGRAIYKGVLKYQSSRTGREYAVQPLPVGHFAITGQGSEFELSWQPTEDPLEPSAKSDYYIVYERVNGGEFTELAVVDEPRLKVNHKTHDIYSYRVVAANSGGVSFPSETLALCNAGDGREPVTIVNGFTRLSGPAEVSTPELLGFDYAKDHGVPYGSTGLFTGEQTEFRRSVPWTTNDSPGLGSSRAWHEGKQLKGNTFDFVYTHGEAIRAAGRSFVSSSLAAFEQEGASTRIVDLILGKQREVTMAPMDTTRFKAFTPALKERLTKLFDDGGALMVSGSYIGTDLFDNQYSTPEVRKADAEFGKKILGIAWRQGDGTAIGKVKEVKSRYGEFAPPLQFAFNQSIENDTVYAVEAPDVFSTADSKTGAVVMRYGENGYPAATVYAPGAWRCVTLGFPFETITEKSARERVMRQVMEFLTSASGAKGK